MVPSGIKVNNRTLYHIHICLAFFYIGEANAGNPKYACYFSQMIQSWRQIWNQRSNGITNIEFPFGFVQVGCT